MNWPPPSVLMPLALQLFTDHSDHSFDETHDFLAARCDLTEEKIERTLSHKEQATWLTRVTNTWKGLDRFGLTETVNEKVAKITEFGTVIAEEKPPKITASYLKHFPEFFKAGVHYFTRRTEQHEEASGTVHRLPSPRRIDENLLRDPRNVLVWFGTNRKPKDYSEPEKGFSTQRDSVPHFGRVVVNIPIGHNVGGEKRGMIQRWFKGTPGLVLKTIESLSEASFWEALRASLKSEVEENSLLLFLHGFRQTFEEAAIRTAQLKYDLKISHAAFYSWPSQANLKGYLADGTSIEAAVPHIAKFLTHLGSLAAGEKVKLHVVAHSMGNRGLLLALQRMLINLKGSKPKFVISDIVFAAADVDRETFIDSVSLTRAFSKRRTLYASQKDRALKASGFLNSMIRAGHLPPVTISSGTDTIDVPNFDFDMLGHGYYATARPVLHDMYDLIHHGTPVGDRQGIEAQKNGKSSYWRLT